MEIYFAFIVVAGVLLLGLIYYRKRFISIRYQYQHLKKMQHLNDQSAKVLWNEVIPASLQNLEITIGRIKSCQSFFINNPEVSQNMPDVINELTGIYGDAKMKACIQLEYAARISMETDAIEDKYLRDVYSFFLLNSLDDDHLVIELYHLLGRPLPVKLYTFDYAKRKMILK